MVEVQAMELCEGHTDDDIRPPRVSERADGVREWTAAWGGGGQRLRVELRLVYRRMDVR